MRLGRKSKEKPKIMGKAEIIETGQEKIEENKQTVKIPDDIQESIETFNKNYAPIFAPQQFQISVQDHTKLTLQFAIFDELKKIREVLERMTEE